MFAKIFQTKHGQVLLFRSYDESDKQSVLIAIGDTVEGITPKAEFGFDNLEEAQKALIDANQAGAEELASFLLNATKLVGGEK